ncbi:MAG TPA: LysR family transcriptional regulator [Candidatus Eisenbacteria bacterium]|nr:LysR family transcriptional regulator [Candidatus Eisenbacteria bacterium]
MKFSSATLACFVQVCRVKGFSPAAEKLGRSQSAISTQIARLESDLGVKLFDRSKRPLLLTEAGRCFLEFATDILNRADRFERYVSELSRGIAGEVKIGASTSVGTYILPGLLSRLLRRSPKLEISLSTQGRSLVFESVRRGEVDFGLVLSDKSPSDLSCEHLKTERLCLIVSPKHPLAKKRRLKISALAAAPFVVGPRGTEYTEMINRILARHHLSGYEVAARISNFDGVKELVQAGVGIGLLPHFMVRREIQDRVLDQLKVDGFKPVARIMRVETPQHLSTPTVERVKRLLSCAISRL